jgi:hypothetical protein
MDQTDLIKQIRSGVGVGGGRPAATGRRNVGRSRCAGGNGSRGTGGRFKLGNTYSIAGRIRDLRKRETQLAGLLEDGVAVSLRLHIRADTADVAHFVKDGTQLRGEQQQCET